MTAEEFLNQQDSYIKNKHVFSAGTGNIIQQNMIEFAKYHVEEAIAEIARIEANSIKEANDDKQYMLKMYPLDLIK